jgi:hypothetical protein
MPPLEGVHVLVEKADLSSDPDGSECAGALKAADGVDRDAVSGGQVRAVHRGGRQLIYLIAGGVADVCGAMHRYQSPSEGGQS